MTKRYLILLLLLMVSTAYADVSFKDYYLTLSDDEKKKHLDYCRVETFPDYFDNKSKSLSCLFAFKYTEEKFHEEENVYKKDGLGNEMIRYFVKACNFNFVDIDKNLDGDRLCYHTINMYYILFKCPAPKTKNEILCEQLKEYKGFK